MFTLKETDNGWMCYTKTELDTLKKNYTIVPTQSFNEFFDKARSKLPDIRPQFHSNQYIKNKEFKWTSDVFEEVGVSLCIVCDDLYEDQIGGNVCGRCLDNVGRPDRIESVMA